MLLHCSHGSLSVLGNLFRNLDFAMSAEYAVVKFMEDELIDVIKTKNISSDGAWDVDDQVNVIWGKKHEQFSATILFLGTWVLCRRFEAMYCDMMDIEQQLFNLFNCVIVWFRFCVL